MKQFHEIDPNNVYMYSIQRQRPAFRQISVAPPTIPTGMCAQWQSELNPKTDLDWGLETTGQWELKEDNRKATLYTPDDNEYKLDTEYEGEVFNGIGSIPSWLSLTKQPPVPPTLSEVQEGQIQQINFAFEQASQNLIDGYPVGERLTWPVQQAEALAWSTNPLAETPYLDGLADARGISVEEMRQKTLDQTLAFMAESQLLVGKRQRLRDEIYDANTIEDVLLIVWE